MIPPAWVARGNQVDGAQAGGSNNGKAERFAGSSGVDDRPSNTFRNALNISSPGFTPGAWKGGASRAAEKHLPAGNHPGPLSARVVLTIESTPGDDNESAKEFFRSGETWIALTRRGSFHLVGF